MKKTIGLLLTTAAAMGGFFFAGLFYGEQKGKKVIPPSAHTAPKFNDQGDVIGPDTKMDHIATTPAGTKVYKLSDPRIIVPVIIVESVSGAVVMR